MTETEMLSVERFGLDTSGCGYQCRAMMESENLGFWVRYSDYERLQSQLAQVEKERDAAREMVTLLTTEKQRAEQVATTMRSRCVEQVKEVRAQLAKEWGSHSYAVGAVTRAVDALESLPLDQVEQDAPMELVTGEFARWWICFPCWKAYYVPTSGYFGPCPDCKSPTLRWPADPNKTLRMCEFSVTEWLEQRKTKPDGS